MLAGNNASFLGLLYRYWFYGWLFRDADRGGRAEREAALNYNRERAIWLPTYMRRWVVLGAGFYCAGCALEWAGLMKAATLAFLPVCVAASVFAVAAAGWLLLRGRRGRERMRL
jgi:hypothetical protein